MTTAIVTGGCAWLALQPVGAAYARESSESSRQMYFNARYLEARLQMARGEMDAARETLELCRTAEGCPEEVFGALARVHATQGDVDKTNETLEDGLKHYPASVDLLLSRASLNRERGRINEAIEDLNLALESEPHRQDVLEMLSELHLSRLISNPAGSREELQKLIAVYNRMLEGRRGQERLVPLLVLSTLYQKVDESEKAVQASAEALEIHPTNTRVYEAHAAALVAAGRVDEAIGIYRRALVMAPDDDEIRRKVEALLSQVGGESRRALFFIELAADYPANAGVQQVSARALMNAKRWPEAESCLRTLMHLKPEDIPNKLALLHVWMEMGKVEDAVAEAKALGKTSGDLAPAITLSLAETLEQQGHRRKAIELLEDFNATHPLNENVMLGTVALLIQDEQNDKAVALLKQVTAEKPQNFVAVALLAEIYASDDRFTDAHSLLDGVPEAMRKAHASDMALLRSGLYINESGQDLDHAHALDLLERALDVLDGMPQSEQAADQKKILALRTGVWINRGVILQRQGRGEEAEDAYHKALDLNPNDADTWNTLGYFYAQTNQKLDEARRMIQKALELEPQAPHIIDSLGWVLYRQGRYDEAVIQLEKAAREMGDRPETAEVYDHLGDVYDKLGRAENAREAWTKAIDLEGEIDPEPIRMKLEQAGR